MATCYTSDYAMNGYLNDIERYTLLTQDDEKRLAKEINEGKKGAVEAMVSANLRLVVKIARGYTSKDNSLIDLIQEGNIGLIRAAEKFDPNMGCKFSTYAAYWIKHYITRYIAKRSRIIRMPIRKGNLYNKILQASNQLAAELGREATVEEISALLDVSLDQVTDLMEAFQSVVSLEEPLNEDGFTLYDTLHDDGNNHPESMTLKDDLKRDLLDALDSLMENEQKIIRKRYGLESNKVHTLKELSEEFKISTETVRQIELRALAKMRKQNDGLRGYMD